jgi:hypothetical protein
MRQDRTRTVVYIQQPKYSFCSQGRPERTAHHGHLLGARVVVHHDLLDLEDSILLGRAGSPTLVAVPINIVSIVEPSSKLLLIGKLTTSCSTSSVHPSQSARSS